MTLAEDLSLLVAALGKDIKDLRTRLAKLENAPANSQAPKVSPIPTTSPTQGGVA